MFELQMEARMDPEGCRPQVETRASRVGISSVRFEKWESVKGRGLSTGAITQLRYVDNALAMTELDPLVS